VSTPINQTLAQRVYITTIAGSRKDARDYARQWLANRQTVEGWYLVQTIGPNNQILEAHDGGSGDSYAIDLVRRFHLAESEHHQSVEESPRPPRVDAMIPAVEKTEVITLSRTGISKLSVDPEEPLDEARLLKAVPGHMMPYQANQAAPFLMGGFVAFGLAAVVLGLAIAAKPIPEPVTLVASQAPPVWAEWAERIKPLNDEPPTQVRYADGEWTWETSE